MHYLGQTHTVAVPLPVTLGGGRCHASMRRSVRAAFDEAYAAAFGRLLPGIPIRIVSLRTAAIGRRPAFDLSAFAPGPDASLEKAAKGSRPVWCRRRLAGDASLVAARPAGRRGDQRPGRARATGRHHLHRSGPARPRRCARQCHRGADVMNLCVNRAAARRSAERLYPSQGRLCARRPGQCRHCRAAGAAEAAGRRVPRARRAGGRDAVHAGAGPRRRADHLAASQGAAAVSAAKAILRPAAGGSSWSMNWRRPTALSRRSPIRPSI